MALVALASIKGAPGVTTTGIALGAVWPAQRSVVVAELDAAGGDLAARHALPAEPSVVTLAAAVRRGHARGETRLIDHCQDLPGGLRVLVGSPVPGEMRSAIDVVADALPALTADSGVDVLADCGRLDSWSLLNAADPAGSERALARPLSCVLRRADLLVLVSRGELADLSRVEAWLPTLRSLNDRFVLLLVGTLSWRSAEVGSVLGAEVLGHLPDDPIGAAVVGGRSHRRRVGRLPLLREAHRAADRIVERLPVVAPRTADDTLSAAVRHGVVVPSEAAP